MVVSNSNQSVRHIDLLDEIKDGRFVDHEGVAWISLEMAVLRLKEIRPTLKDSRWKNYLLYVWKTRCVHLGGDALERKSFTFKEFEEGAGTWFKEQQIDDIVVALRAKEDAQRRKEFLRKAQVSRGTGVKRTRRKRAIEQFNGVWTEVHTNPTTQEKHVEKRFSVPAAERESERRKVPIPRQRLYHYIKPKSSENKNDGIPAEWPDEYKKKFPAGSLPTERRLVPGSDSHWLPTIHEDDLATLLAIELALAKPTSSTHMSVPAICTQFGITKLRDKVWAGRCLKHLEEHGKVVGGTFPHRVNGNRAWKKGLLIETNSLERLLNGRAFLDFVNDFRRVMFPWFVQQAKVVLAGLLQPTGSWKRRCDVVDLLKKQDVSWELIYPAKAELRIESERPKGQGRGSRWQWRLPEGWVQIKDVPSAPVWPKVPSTEGRRAGQGSGTPPKVVPRETSRDDTIVVLHDEKKLSFGQIGKQLNITYEAARKAYHRRKARTI